MSQRAIGWAFVALQAALIVVLVVLGGRGDWPTPGWLVTIGYVLFFGGVAIIGVAALRLGPALTATPVPTTSGQLTTTGLYRWARHPIYTGVFAIVAGITVRSASWPTLAVAVGLVVFFNVKARWEEARLADRYSGYPAYAAVTPRFIPRPWR